MPITRAEAFAPATVANVGVGFDIMGLAVGEPGDVVIAEWDDTPGARIVEIKGDGGKLPHAPEKNTATVAANSLLRQVGADHGARLTICKGIPAASGLGSSAASAVAGVVAVNALLAEPLAHADLLPACLDGEAAVSGYHPDNVAPCLLGGIILAYGLTPDKIVQLPVPDGLYLAIVTPAVEVPTVEARAVLPDLVPRQHMIRQTAAVARLVDALHRGDIPALGAAMESDMVIEPARAHLMPLLKEARAAAHEIGAAGLAISGAGPTLCAVCPTKSIAEQTANAFGALYKAANLDCMVQAAPISMAGAHVVKAT
ncbi:MAG: homoserine kinase [Chloroflexi bacterium]|nr:homoserine kinase [Chloroflexota bacterium]